MPESPVLTPELVRQSVALARALSAAARNWAIYPPEHGAVTAAVLRLGEALQASAAGVAFSFGVTPTTLLVADVPLPEEQPVADAARLLHDHDILTITFVGSVPPEGLQSLLRLLAIRPDDLRAGGGPAKAWEADGHASITIEQIDFEKILEDNTVEAPAIRRDDLWRSIVTAMANGRGVFDEAQQERLLHIAGSAGAISDLATEVAAPKCSADGSPLITTQAATVVAVFRHVSGIVQVLAPDQLPDVMRNVAAATAAMSPHVVLQMMQAEDPLQESPIVERIAAAFDDEKVATLLAGALARDGMATARLAQVFETIAPDIERRRRVLTMTRDFLRETDFGKAGQFKAAWASMEGLLLNYDEKPYVSESYQTALAVAAERGAMLAARDLPEELPEWMETLGQDNVRSLSVLLITDLLRIEENVERAAEIARDVAALGEDLLMSGAFDDALIVIKTLTTKVPKPIAKAARAAAAALGGSGAMREAASLLGDLDEKTLAIFSTCCTQIGPTTVQALQPALESEHETPAFARARDIVRKYGTGAAAHLAKMADDPRWFVQRNAAALLGATRSPDALPPLQALLRRQDPRVLRAAIAALASIEDPAAARTLQTALRAATGENRKAVIDALVAERDPRVVPMLVRILEDVDPFSDEHQTALDALNAARELKDERAVPAIASLMRKKRFFARTKARAVKGASVQALRAIGTPRARQALDDAAKAGDRLLRAAIRASA